MKVLLIGFGDATAASLQVVISRAINISLDDIEINVSYPENKDAIAQFEAKLNRFFANDEQRYSARLKAYFQREPDRIVFANCENELFARFESVGLKSGNDLLPWIAGVLRKRSKGAPCLRVLVGSAGSIEKCIEVIGPKTFDAAVLVDSLITDAGGVGMLKSLFSVYKRGASDLSRLGFWKVRQNIFELTILGVFLPMLVGATSKFGEIVFPSVRDFVVEYWFSHYWLSLFLLVSIVIYLFLLLHKAVTSELSRERE